MTSSPETSQLIAKAMNSEPGGLVVLPLDPSMGKALIMEGGELSLVEELQKGGIWIYPIVFFAALSLLIAIFKAIQILGISPPVKLHPWMAPSRTFRNAPQDPKSTKVKSTASSRRFYETIIGVRLNSKRLFRLSP